MFSRAIVLALLPAILAASAAAQSKKPRVTLPAAMLGVWGSDADACKGAPIEAENRLEVAQDGLMLYVTAYGVKTWQRNGDSYSARATRGEEGEGAPSRERHTVALKLLPDGKLQFRVDRQPAEPWVKCPAGTVIQ